MRPNVARVMLWEMPVKAGVSHHFSQGGVPSASAGDNWECSSLDYWGPSALWYYLDMVAFELAI